MYITRSKNLFPNSVRIGLVDPDVAQTWAQRTSPDGTIVGEVKKGDTINHTTSQPIANGLFCQRIFGPCVDYTCACGQTKIPIHSNIHVSSDVCPDCLVEWTESSVRRQRLGFIQLISPVTHKWFADSGSAYIPALMGTTVKTFKGIRDCKLFFPFSLQNIDKENSRHRFSCKASIAKAKSKSGDLLLRGLLCNTDTKSNKKESIKSSSFDTIAGLRSFVSVDSFALLTGHSKYSKYSKQQEKRAKEAEGVKKITPTHVVLKEGPMGSYLRAMQKMVAASYERYRNQQANIKQNGETSGFNLYFDATKEKTQNPKPGRREGVSSVSELNYDSSTICFNGYHSFPVRPSFAQSEDYRRKFVKFFGNTGATSFALQEANKLFTSKNKRISASLTSTLAKQLHSKKEAKKAIAVPALLTLQSKYSKQSKKKKHRLFRDIPIVRYTKQCQSPAKPNKPNSITVLDKPFFPLTQQEPKPGGCLATALQSKQLLALLAVSCAEQARACCAVRSKQAKQSNCIAKGKHSKQVYNCVVRNHEFPVKSYFSELNSAAKEQTIKRILAQTGGGGLQKYLGLVDLGYLVALLKNDLDEITPHLNRYGYAKSILRNALNKTSSDLSQTCNLLEKLQTNYWATVEHLTGHIPTGPELFEKIARLEENYEYGKAEYKAAKKLYKILEKRKTAHKRRYKLASQLWRTMSNPVGLTMSSVPVLPPGLRPIIEVPKVGPIASDLNVRYRKLVFALRNLRDLSYVDFRITGAAQSSIQEAVDDILYTGGKRNTVIKTQSGRNPSVYKSLAMGLKGKHGRFRGNLLGKRVDYSGRSVIVVGPTLKIHQCGLPFSLAIKLFHPFLIRRLMQKGFCKTVYAAKKALGNSRFNPQLWALCREEMLEHLVVLNRAPTLHRLGVQAFMPVLIAGRAILLHPLVCTAFNADFDGDQMAVHVPLFPQAKAEAWKMMWSRNNFLAPSSGDPILLPSQDMVLGCYYLTESVLEGLKNPCFTFSQSRVSSANAVPKQSRGSNRLLGLQGNCFGTCEAIATCLLRTRSNASAEQAQQEVSLAPQPEGLLSTKTERTCIANTHYSETALTVLQKNTPEILSVKAALDGYTKGVYNLHSIVWVSPKGAIHINYRTAKENIFDVPVIPTLLPTYNKSKTKQTSFGSLQASPTFMTSSGASLTSSFAKKPLLNLNKGRKAATCSAKEASPWKSLIPNGLEGDKSSTPTLELRVSPYGITRLFQTTGSKKRNFYSAMLLPANRTIQNSSFEIASIRTTIGRLLFNDILQKFEIISLAVNS